MPRSGGLTLRKIILTVIAAFVFFGLVTAGNSQQTGFIYSNGTYTTFNVPGADVTYLRGINNSGEIVGEYYLGAAQQAFLFNSGQFTNITPPSSDGSYAFGINNSGQIVGSDHQIGGAQYSGYLFSGGSFNTNFPSGQLNGINDAGQIVGTFGPSFIYSGGTYTTVAFPGAVATDAVGINNSGQIVGAYNVGGGAIGFEYSNGIYTSLMVPGALVTYATGINNLGQIVGYDYIGGFANDDIHGFLYSNGTYTTVDFPSGVYNIAEGINDSGQIVGFSYIPPVGGVPEPSTWAMMILGFAGIGFMAYRRRTIAVLMAFLCLTGGVYATPFVGETFSGTFTVDPAGVTVNDSGSNLISYGVSNLSSISIAADDINFSLPVFAVVSENSPGNTYTIAGQDATRSNSIELFLGGQSSPLSLFPSSDLSYYPFAATVFVETDKVPSYPSGFFFAGNLNSFSFDSTTDVGQFGGIIYANSVPTPSVPEPSTWAMMILGFAGIGFMACRSKNKLALKAA
jgi:probable HAF family extracellular repeat protein